MARQTTTKRTRFQTALLLVTIGGAPLSTTVSCDPLTGSIDIFRHDNSFDFVDVFVEDCFPFECFYDGGVVFFD